MRWLLAPGRCLDHLSADPRCGRVGCRVHVHEFSPAVGEEHQNVQRLEGERLHRQQIRGPEVGRVVGQEGPPGLAGRVRRPTPPVAWIERLETTSPSFSNSPRIRSLPQRGLARAIVAISSRTSALSRGRPIGLRERQRQNRRQARRCQRMTLSGRTTTRCRRQSPRRARTSTQNSLSRARGRGRLRVGRVNTAS